jgi:hypothetical protein
MMFTITSKEARQKTERHLKELEAKIHDLTDALTKAREDASVNLSGAKSESHALRQQLDKANSAISELTTKLQEASGSRDGLAKSLKQIEAELVQTRATLAARDKLLAQAKSEKDKLTADLLGMTKARDEVKARLAVREKELTEKLREANGDRARLSASSDNLAKQLKAGLAAQEKQSRLVKQAEEKIKDQDDDNAMLLEQLHQVQEELVGFYEAKVRVEALYQALHAKWARLEKRVPDYVDFSDIEIVDVDSMSETPGMTWRMRDVSKGAISLPDLTFKTLLQEGNPGIALMNGTEFLKKVPLVPKLVTKSKLQLTAFLQYSTTEYQTVLLAVELLAKLDAARWKGVTLPANFDTGFWQPVLAGIVAQVRALPPVLRYNDVKLKRELVNPDYEHLWLEIEDLVLGKFQCPKFEIRLGAALVQPNGFSSYPKFEIPLIDGKHKPFGSWFAEAHDDIGPKLELRFSLVQGNFDVGVWNKLSEADRVLMSSLIFAFPQILRRLASKKTAIHRNWDTWAEFATGAVKVLQAFNARLKAAPAATQAQGAKLETSQAGQSPSRRVSAAVEIAQKAQPTSTPAQPPALAAPSARTSAAGSTKAPMKIAPAPQGRRSAASPVKAAKLAGNPKRASKTEAGSPAKPKVAAKSRANAAQKAPEKKMRQAAPKVALAAPRKAGSKAVSPKAPAATKLKIIDIKTKPSTASKKATKLPAPPAKKVKPRTVAA